MRKIILLTLALILSVAVIVFAEESRYTIKEKILFWTNCTSTNCVPDTGPDLTRLLANDLKAKLNAHAADAAEHVVTAITIDDCVTTNFGVTSHTYVVGSKLLVGTASECGLILGRNYYVCSVVGANDITISANSNCQILVDGDGDTSITTDLARVTDNIHFPVTARDVGEDEQAALFTLIGQMLRAYASHNTDAALTTPLYHVADVGGGNALSSSATPTTMALAATRIDDLKAKYNLHDADATGHTTGSLHLESITDYPIPLTNAKKINIQCDSLNDVTGAAQAATNHTATNWDWKVLTSSLNTGLTADFDAVSTPYFESNTDSVGVTRTVDIVDTINMRPSNNYWTMRLDENASLRADVTCYITWKE